MFFLEVKRITKNGRFVAVNLSNVIVQFDEKRSDLCIQYYSFVGDTVFDPFWEVEQVVFQPLRIIVTSLALNETKIITPLPNSELEKPNFIQIR